MEHVRTIDREYATGGHAVLHIEGRAGGITVEGADSTSVRIEATVRIWSDLAVEADEAAAQVEQGMEPRRWLAFQSPRSICRLHSRNGSSRSAWRLRARAATLATASRTAGSATARRARSPAMFIARSPYTSSLA